MGLLNRIFSSPPRNVNTVTPAPSQPEAPPSAQLPSDTPAADRHAWHRELGNARMLLDELDDLQREQQVHLTEKLIKRGPSLPVQPNTLLEPAHVSDPKTLTERLHANRLPNGSVVMATPTQAQRKLWQESAQAHQVTHVVRVGTDLESTTMDHLAHEPAVRAQTLPGQPPQVLSRYWRVFAKPGMAISPAVLRDTFEKLSATPPAPGCRVAFQSPDGDERSAVFGAGWKVFNDLRAMQQANQPVLEDTVLDVVQDAVMQTHMNRSTQLLRQPEHLASLLAMGMQLCGLPRARTVRFADKPTVESLGAQTKDTPPDGPALKEARNRAAARALCSGILEMKEATGPAYAPLKGSTAATRRIHPDAMLAPDARLKSLPGARLLGAWAAPRTLVLERPGPDKALAWATACLTHNISAVVDLSCRSEQIEPDAMANGRQSLRSGTEVNFDWGPSGQIEMDHVLPGAKATGMQISATIDGQPVTRDVSIDPPYMDDKHRIPTERSLERLQIPLLPGKTVPPKHLLEIAKLMENYRSDGPGHAVAVQCPKGDVRAAVVAAADLLYGRFQEKRLDADNLDESIKDIWTGLCLNYSIDLAHEPDQLASLMAMGELLLATGKHTARWQ